jgi:hypothetical protein
VVANICWRTFLESSISCQVVCLLEYPRASSRVEFESFAGIWRKNALFSRPPAPCSSAFFEGTDVLASIVSTISRYLNTVRTNASFILWFFLQYHRFLDTTTCAARRNEAEEEQCSAAQAHSTSKNDDDSRRIQQ